MAPQTFTATTIAPIIPPAPVIPTLRVPNISVCFVQNQIGFLNTERIKEICNSMSDKLKGANDKELRKMFVKSMR